MNATIAAQMVGADFLKLRKKRGTLIWALVLALAPLVIFFIVRAAQHSSNPIKHEPAGGLSGYSDAAAHHGAVLRPARRDHDRHRGRSRRRWPRACSATSSSPAARAWRCSPRACPPRSGCAGW